MVAAGVVFAATSWVPLLILAATIGVISPTGNEVGPFLAVEQAALSQVTPDARRTPIFAWYNLAGSSRPRSGRCGAGSARPGAPGGGPGARRRVPGDRRRLRDRRAGAGRGLRRVGRRRGSAAGSCRGRRDRPPPRASGGRRASSPGSRRSSPRRLRRRLHPPEPDGVLVPPPVRRRAGGPRRDLLRRQHARRGVSAGGVADRGPDRAREHDGLHPPAVERAPDPRPAHADACRSRSPSCSLRFSLSQMDVPTRQSLHDGRRRAGRAIGGGRRDRDRPDDGRRDLAGARRRRSSATAALAGAAVLHRRRPEDRLRPRPVARLPRPSGARGAPGLRRAMLEPPGQPRRAGLGRRRRQPGIPRRHQTKRTTRATTATAIARSNGWRAWRMSTQFAPSCCAGEDEEDRPRQGAGRRVDDELAEGHPGHAGRERDERPDDRQEAAEEGRRRARSARRTARRARSRGAGSGGTCPSARGTAGRPRPRSRSRRASRGCSRSSPR